MTSKYIVLLYIHLPKYEPYAIDLLQFNWVLGKNEILMLMILNVDALTALRYTY